MEGLVMAQETAEHQYRVTAWWTSGRTGLAKSDTAPNAIHFTAPAQFGGIEGRWTPEDLLLAAVAGCFTTTLRSLASSAQADFTDLEVAAYATLRKMESGYGFSEIVLRPTLRIADSERGRALDLLKKAERLCLVSRAFAMPLRFEPQLEVMAALSPLP
jgi:organic hydroperoxide reductase OsmC/OhrA